MCRYTLSEHTSLCGNGIPSKRKNADFFTMNIRQHADFTETRIRRRSVALTGTLSMRMRHYAKSDGSYMYIYILFDT